MRGFTPMTPEKLQLHFKQGKLQDYEHSSKGEWK